MIERSIGLPEAQGERERPELLDAREVLGLAFAGLYFARKGGDSGGEPIEMPGEPTDQTLGELLPIDPASEGRLQQELDKAAAAQRRADEFRDNIIR